MKLYSLIIGNKIESNKRLSDGYYDITIKAPREPETHHKYMQMINIVLQNLPEYLAEKGLDNFDSLREFMQYSAGFVKPFWNGKEFQYNVKSIAYENLDEAEFKELYFKVYDVARKILQTEIPETEFIIFSKKFYYPFKKETK